MYYSVSDYDTSTFNKSDDKFQEKQYKKVTRHILKIVHCKVHFQINHRRLIIIANTSILNISSKVWIYSFAGVNLHHRYRFSFSYWIKKVALAAKMEDTACILNHRGPNIFPSLLCGRI